MGEIQSESSQSIEEKELDCSDRSDRSEEGLAFRKFDADSTIDKLHDSLVEEIHAQRREGQVDNTTDFMDKLVKLPRPILKTIMSVLLKLALAGGIFFVVTFVIYFFNLDMKATSMLEPFLEKWYDRLERKQYI